MTNEIPSPAYVVAEGHVHFLNARELYDLHSRVWDLAQTQARKEPAMTHVEDENGMTMQLRCPHCEEDTTSVYDVDVSLRWTKAGQMSGTDAEGYALHAAYGHADYEGDGVYLCPSCEGVVTLPQDVEVVAV